MPRASAAASAAARAAGFAPGFGNRQGGNGGAATGTAGAGRGFTAGTITAIDGDTITLKLANGSTVKVTTSGTTTVDEIRRRRSAT